MDLLDCQPEFTKSFWDYLDILVTEDAHRAAAASCWRSIARPSTRWRRPTASTATSSRRSGASKSNYGTHGRRPPGDPLDRDARLRRPAAGLFPRRISRRRWKSSQRGDVRPDHLIGSWAGAFGPTQFMPTSFKRFAVDFDGDGRRDVVDSVADMHRLDRQQPARRTAGSPARPGATRSWCRRTSISCWPTARSS